MNNDRRGYEMTKDNMTRTKHMSKKNIRGLIIVLITCVLSDVSSNAVSLTNIVALKIVLLCLSAICSITTIVCAIVFIIRLFSAPSEVVPDNNYDKMMRKNKMIRWIFVINLIVVSIVFGIFLFLNYVN